MIFSIKPSHLFKKQLRKVIRQGKSEKKIKSVIFKLADDGLLSSSFKVHKLKGTYKGMFELHIEPDLLLIYEYEHEILVLHLIQIGSHSELFD